MQRNRVSRMLPLIVVIIIGVLLIAGVISAGRAIFGGETTETSHLTDEGKAQLLKTSQGNSVRLTVRGPIVAEENFHYYHITISPTQRDMTVYEGYTAEVVRTEAYGNNAQAYEQFVYALDRANMMRGEEPEEEVQDDLRGICATGYVYEYSVRHNDDPVKRLWTSTCDGSPGSLEASTDQLNNLFFAQIPDSKELSPFQSNPLELRF